MISSRREGGSGGKDAGEIGCRVVELGKFVGPVVLLVPGKILPP